MNILDTQRKKKLVRKTKFHNKNRKRDPETEKKIAEDYTFNNLSGQEVADRYGLAHRNQVYDICSKYELMGVKDTKREIEMTIQDKDAEFVAFLLTEYQIDFEFKNLLIQSTL